MTQGRKDLLPGEVSDRILNVPTRKKVSRKSNANRTAGRKGREGILSNGVGKLRVTGTAPQYETRRKDGDD